jgi:hypothetical protein
VDAAEIDAFEAELVQPRLKRLLRQWVAVRGERELPARADFSPFTLDYLLGNIILFDVLQDPQRFRYRLIGTNIVRRRGFGMTGKHLDEHPDAAFRDMALPVHEQVVAGRRPLRQLFDMIGSTGQTVQHEILVLPLSKDGDRIDMLLVGQVYLDAP